MYFAKEPPWIPVRKLLLKQGKQVIIFFFALMHVKKNWLFFCSFRNLETEGKPNFDKLHISTILSSELHYDF